MARVLSECLATLSGLLINRRRRCRGNKVVEKVMAAAPGVAALEALRAGVQAEAQRHLTWMS